MQMATLTRRRHPSPPHRRVPYVSGQEERQRQRENKNTQIENGQLRLPQCGAVGFSRSQVLRLCPLADAVERHCRMSKK